MADLLTTEEMNDLEQRGRRQGMADVLAMIRERAQLEWASGKYQSGQAFLVWNLLQGVADDVESRLHAEPQGAEA